MKHPMQPIVRDRSGVVRFQRNHIVAFLLDKGGFDLNDLAKMNFDRKDWVQFAQLLGYSVSGFGDLPYVNKADVAEADTAAAALEVPDAVP